MRQREELPGRWIGHDSRGDLELADPLGQDAVHLALERQVDGQHDVRSRARRDDAEEPDLAAGRVDLDPPLPARAAELRLELRLDPGLADPIERRVRAGWTAGGPELRLGDRADVAEQVARQRSVDVLPPRLRLDGHAGQLRVALLDRLGHRRIGGVQERHAREGIVLPGGDGPGELRRAAAGQLGQPPVHRLRAARQVGRRRRDGENRPVPDQGDPVAVVDQAARGRERADP